MFLNSAFIRNGSPVFFLILLNFVFYLDLKKKSKQYNTPVQTSRMAQNMGFEDNIKPHLQSIIWGEWPSLSP